MYHAKLVALAIARITQDSVAPPSTAAIVCITHAPRYMPIAAVEGGATVSVINGYIDMIGPGA